MKADYRYQNKSTLALTVAILFVLSMAAGCKTITAKSESRGPTVQEAVTYTGPKARITVSSFKCKAAKCGGRIGDGLSDMLTTALFQSNRFVVLESGSGLDAALREQELSQSGIVREGTGPDSGLMEAADLVVTGSITGFEPEAEGMGMSLFGLGSKFPALAGLGGKTKEAWITADIRLVDTRTRRIVNVTTVEGRATSWGVQGLGAGRVGGIPLGGALGMYANTPMEKAVRVMLDNAVSTISTMVPKDYYRVTE